LSDSRQELEVVSSQAGTLADDLESARPRQLVYVDRKGEVQSARRYRTLNRLGLGLIVSIGVGATVAYGLVLGAGGVAIASLAVALGSLPWWQYRRLSRGVKHLVKDELEQAEQCFLRVSKGFLVPKQVRALAMQNLGAVEIRRGNFETALGRQRQARALFSKVWRKPIFSHMADISVVHTLIELGHLGEASALLLEVKGRIPEGKYLRIQLWSVELYLAFAEGEHTFSDDELYKRSRESLQISSAVGLLLLLSWAYWESGDADEAGLLMAQALEREGIALVERTMPRLWTWVSEHTELADSGADELD
jgi:tetratricopeptide (TPR) repeat protein